MTVAGEQGWLISYGIASFLYRMFIMTAIVLFVASQFFIIGVILAIWALTAIFGMPTVKGIWYLFTSPVLRRSRRRAVCGTGAVVTAIAGALLVIPVPHGTVVKGTVWVPEKAMVHAGTDGFISRILVPPNTLVRRGEPLVRLEDPLLDARLRVAEALVREASARLVAVQFADPVQAAITREQLTHAEARRVRLQERVARLTVMSEIAGRFVLPMAADHDGRFVRKGTLIGFVVDPASSVVRVAVWQDDIDPIRSRLRATEVRFAGKVWETVPAGIRRAVPAATSTLSSKMLSTEGGGDVVLDPTDPARTLEKVFEIDLSIPVSSPTTMIGGRVFVRFDHGAEPLAWRAFRRFRQLFLREFNV